MSAGGGLDRPCVSDSASWRGSGSCYSYALVNVLEALFLASAAAFCVSLVKQRLNGGLPLSAEELENVFHTLDSDGNGYLTLDEFSSGFSMFPPPPHSLFIPLSPSAATTLASIARPSWQSLHFSRFYFFPGEFLFGQRSCAAEADSGEGTSGESPAEVLYQSQWEESLARGDEDEERRHFAMLMESLGGNSVFEE